MIDYEDYCNPGVLPEPERTELVTQPTKFALKLHEKLADTQKVADLAAAMLGRAQAELEDRRDEATALRQQLSAAGSTIIELERELHALKTKLQYIEATAYAGEASPNARDFRRIMEAAKEESHG